MQITDYNGRRELLMTHSGIDKVLAERETEDTWK